MGHLSAHRSEVEGNFEVFHITTHHSLHCVLSGGAAKGLPYRLRQEAAESCLPGPAAQTEDSPFTVMGYQTFTL